MSSRNPFWPLCRLTLPLLVALLALPVMQARADNYVGYRRIGSWNLAKKTAPNGKRIEMMAVAPAESETDFFLIMCASTTGTLYLSLVTKDPALTVEEPLRLDVGYDFDGTQSHFQMHKVLVDTEAVLRDDDKAHVEAIVSALGKARRMTVTAGAFTRGYELDGFSQAFTIVEAACRRSAPS
jgi:hypothetical protein